VVDFQVGVPPCFDSACPVCGSRAGWPGFAPARCPSTTAHATARRSRRTWLPPAPRTGRVLDPGRPPYMAATTSSQLVFPASPGQGTVAMGSLRTPRTAAAVLAIGAALLTGWPAAAFGITAVIAGGRNLLVGAPRSLPYTAPHQLNPRDARRLSGLRSGCPTAPRSPFARRLRAWQQHRPRQALAERPAVLRSPQRGHACNVGPGE
jgi:hypothetical protein